MPFTPSSTSKQYTASESLLSLPIPPIKRIFVDEILMDANRLSGHGILISGSKVTFFSLISYLSIEFRVPSSLL